MLQAWKSAIVQHERYSKTSTLMIEVSAEAIVKDHLAELEAKAKRCDAYEAVDVDCVSCEDKRAYIDGVFICPRCFIETQENKAKAAAFDNLRKRGTDWD